MDTSPMQPFSSDIESNEKKTTRKKYKEIKESRVIQDGVTQEVEKYKSSEADNTVISLEDQVKKLGEYVVGEIVKINDKIDKEFEEIKQTRIKEKETFEKELRITTDRFIEIIGIFAALLSFVAFEAQIFKGPLSVFALVGVSLIVFGALLTFVIVLDVSFEAFDTQGNRWKWLLFGLASLCVVGGGIFAWIGYEKEGSSPAWVEKYPTRQEVETDILKIKMETQDSKDDDELLIFKNCILRRGLANCLE